MEGWMNIQTRYNLTSHFCAKEIDSQMILPCSQITSHSYEWLPQLKTPQSLMQVLVILPGRNDSSVIGA